jgi:hypothetical protein
MPDANSKPERYLGLDIHKHYPVAIGVDQDQELGRVCKLEPHQNRGKLPHGKIVC